MAEAGSHADVGLFVDHGPDAQRSAVFEVLVDAAVLAAKWIFTSAPGAKTRVRRVPGRAVQRAGKAIAISSGRPTPMLSVTRDSKAAGARDTSTWRTDNSIPKRRRVRHVRARAGRGRARGRPRTCE
jgi:hypothetical protein